MPLHVPPSLALPPTLTVALATVADETVLTDTERAARDAFGHADRRLAFGLGRTAARRLLAEALGIAPADVPLTVGADGAPLAPGYDVSIAHTGRGPTALAAAAVSRGPVGVDVEAVGPRRADLWRRLLSPPEHAVLDALGGPTDSAQTLLWALKESVLKGQRTGFRVGARSVVLASGDGAGHVRAVSEQSGAWEVAYARLGGAWLTVAWPASR